MSAKALAGYIDTRDGRHPAYALYVNDVPVASLQDLLSVGDDLGRISAMRWAEKPDARGVRLRRLGFPGRRSRAADGRGPTPRSAR